MKPSKPLQTLLTVLFSMCTAARAAEDARGSMTLSPDYAVGAQSDLPRPTDDYSRIEMRSYADFGAVEWQVGLRRESGAAPALIEDPCSADFTAAFPSRRPTTLHWSKGSHSETSDFAPQERVLEHGVAVALASFGGRSSDGAMPYFNLNDGKGGIILAIGWTGDWTASFASGEPGQVHISAGLDRTHFMLPPDEELRLPSILLMPYAGDWTDGQNKFRRLTLRHFTPANHSPMELMPVAASVHGLVGFNDTTEANLCELAAVVASAKLPIDTFWLDAGWNEAGFPLGQGNPHPDPTRFPRGLAPVGAAAAANGLRFLVWFEPERVMRGTWLDREHPDWLLLPSGTPPDLRYHENDGFRLLDLGNPAAREWTLDSVSRTLETARIAIYRQDFNLYPAYFWHTNEPAEEQGLRQVRYIGGLYAYLDALRERFPGLIIDNCASGGRRLDFEMMRRSVPLWRSDSCWDSKDFPHNVQAMSHGLSLWLPLHGLGAASTDTAALRSGMGACASYAIHFRDPAAIEALRAHLERYLKVRPLYAADYYPLTPWSTDRAAWLAWQFNDTESGRGIVQAFCGDTQGREDFTVRLRGLDAEAYYVIANWDRPETLHMTGKDLMESGLPLRATRADAAIVIEYGRELS